MHYQSVISLSFATIPLVARVVYGEGIFVPELFVRHAKSTSDYSQLGSHQRRQDVDRCGPEYNDQSCADDECCSGAGWCGTGTDYCAAPDCQFEYGPACDYHQTPPGSDTSCIDRTNPNPGVVGEYDTVIYNCNVPGTVALTFDDGPYGYTEYVLDVFKSYGIAATFFVTGNNLGKGEIDNTYYPWAALIQRMEDEGHQIASHSWSHQDLDALTQQQRMDQMYKNEIAIRNIIGKFPTYMRPPFSRCSEASGCVEDMKTLGYHITSFDLNTDDYNNLSPELIANAKNIFDDAIIPSDPNNDEFLVIAHDIHQQVAENLTEHMVQTLINNGYSGVTVGDCLNDPKENWYRSSSGSVYAAAPVEPIRPMLSGNCTATTSTINLTTSTQTTSSVATQITSNEVSPDSTCGGDTGYTCKGSASGSCCSQYGWCGDTTNHCGTGCQADFGDCGMSAVSDTTVSVVSPTAVSTDATCGGNTGYTCSGSIAGNCCSQYGWCGNTDNHCSTGCQADFGQCQ